MRLNIAVIDRGIETTHPALAGCDIRCVTIHEDHRITLSEKDGFSDIDGHGTAIAAKIYHLLPKATITGVKLNSERIPEDLLCAGIEWCIAQGNIHVMNISLGVTTREPSANLYDTCLKAVQQGMLIVAAGQHTTNIHCYPAHFPFVIGVGNGIFHRYDQYSFLQAGAGINVLANGGMQKVAWRENGYRIKSGTSFAAAYVTAAVARHVVASGHTDLNSANTFLYDTASQALIDTSTRQDRILSSRQNVHHPETGMPPEIRQQLQQPTAVFPISSQEIQTMLKYGSERLPLLTTCIDFPGNFNLCAFRPDGKAVSVLHYGVRDEDYARFSTIVIGACTEGPIQRIVYVRYFLTELIKRNMNIITWDEKVYDIAMELFHDGYTGRIYFIPVSYYPAAVPDELHHLPAHTAPVLGVIGTGNYFDILELRLSIVGILQKMNIRVAHIATDPASLLLGADLLFPYHSTLYTEAIVPAQWERLLKALLNATNREKRPDAFVAGPPNRILSDKTDRRYDNGITQLKYLSALKPDVIICKLRLNDTAEYTERLKLILSTFIPYARLLLIKPEGLVEMDALYVADDGSVTMEESIECALEKLFQTGNIPVP